MPLGIASAWAAAGDTAAALEINWGIVGPIVVNALGTVCALAYMFGTVNQKIRALDRALERVHIDVEQIRVQNRDTDKRVHEVALVLGKLDAKFDMFASAVAETAACPIFRDAVKAKKHDHTATIGHDE